MSYVIKFRDDSSSLSHYGIKGQRWGVRRYQNEDGTLTPEGQKRYNQKEQVKSNIKYGVAAALGSLGALGSSGIAGLAAGVEAKADLEDPGQRPTKDTYEDTAAGKSQLKADQAAYDAKKQAYNEKMKVSSSLGNESPKIKRTTDAVAESIINSTKKKDLDRLKNSVDVSKISDDKLRKTVNRMQLERQYLSLTTPETTKGAEIAKGVINVVGGLGAVAVTGLNIVLLSQLIKRNRSR